MRQLLTFIYFIIFILLIACQAPVKKSLDEKYVAEIVQQREIKNIEFSDSLASPLLIMDIQRFHGLKYFEPDEIYRVKAPFVVDTSMPVFPMATTTERLPNYRVYGYAVFKLKDTLCRLAVYQNFDYKDDPNYGNNLFVPFRDASNGKQTYEAGRYIDIPIPVGDTVILDFNTAYNPYCAYNKRWSCPLVPSENILEIAILAGELKFK